MTEAVVGQSFSYGRVFRRVTSALADNAVVFGVLILLFYILPMGLTQLVWGAPETFSATGSTGTLAGTVVGFFINPLLLISIAFAALAHFDGRPVELSKSVAACPKRYLRVLGVTVLFNLGVGVGLILLVVPGLILGTMWAVVVPAAVEGETGDSSFDRSSDLTHGYRWPVFGLVLLFFLGIVVLFAVLAALLYAIGAVVGTDLMNESGGAFDAFTLLADALTVLLSTVGIAAIYHELRFLREGAGSSSLAEVFA